MCGCQIGKGESQATIEGIKKAIGEGNAYLLSDIPLYPVIDWAKHAILVERVELELDDEAYVFLTVAVTVIQENAASWETKWLIRHESPTSEHDLSSKFISQLRVALGHDRTYGKHRLIIAAHDGDEELVERLVLDQSELSDFDEKGWTALHAASVSGKLKVVKILLAKPPRFNPNATDNVGRTPLLLAAENGYDDIVDFLIDSGADPNYRHPESLMSTLDQAIKYDRSSTLQLLLLKGADPNKPNSMGLTPLVWACTRPEMVRILLAHSADPSILTSQGITALHFAARGGSVEAINKFLDHGMDPNLLEARSRRNPLHSAITEQEEDAVVLLLHRGADPNVVYDNGWTPLMLACKMGHLKICCALVEAGARTAGQEKCSPEGWTALHIAAMGKIP